MGEVTVTGHVNEVHANKWLAVYVYCPETVGRELFARVRERANRFVNKTWPTSKCIVPGHAIGNTPEGLHYYTFWLPGPERTPADFNKFFT